jgi:hypothetical protein
MENESSLKEIILVMVVDKASVPEISLRVPVDFSATVYKSKKMNQC